MPVSTSLFLKSIKPALINSRILQEQIFVGITSGKMFKKLRKKKNCTEEANSKCTKQSKVQNKTERSIFLFLLK